MSPKWLGGLVIIRLRSKAVRKLVKNNGPSATQVIGALLQEVLEIISMRSNGDEQTRPFGT
jgi:hypothetical protein